jgi:hypothetical protein
MEPARDLVDAPPQLPDVFARWFAGRGWQVHAHQLALLARANAGRSALLIAPTGGGKTLAGFLPTLVELSERGVRSRNLKSTGRALVRPQGLHTLYISPLKALAVDIARNLEIPVQEMGLPVRLETRTGDTPTSKRQRQRRDPPDILLSTPEQLALLLASADAPYMFGTLKRVILDELHSLVTSKRGDLLSLGLARLFKLAPELITIGLSATVAKPDELRRFLVAQPPDSRAHADLVTAQAGAQPILIPKSICHGPVIRRAMPSERSTHISRRTRRPWYSSTPAVRQSFFFRSCGATTTIILPLRSITAHSMSGNGVASKTRWPRASCARWFARLLSILAWTGAMSIW